LANHVRRVRTRARPELLHTPAAYCEAAILSLDIEDLYQFRGVFVHDYDARVEQWEGRRHWGLETQDIKGTVATFRQCGLTVSEPGALSALTSGILANINDPVYGRIELAEQSPGGTLRKSRKAGS